MKLAVPMVLTGGLPQLILTLVFSGSKSRRKAASQSGASPPLAESLVALVAGVRPTVIGMVNELLNKCSLY